MGDEGRLKDRSGQGITGYCLASLLIGIIAGSLFSRLIFPEPVPSTSLSARSIPGFRLVVEAWNAVERNYIDRSAIAPERMAHRAISGMVEGLSDSGNGLFLPGDTGRERKLPEPGVLAGIGAEVKIRNNLPVIVAPLDGSSARAAGISPGEIIEKIDGKEVAGMRPAAIVRMTQGRAGTSVALTVRNPVSGVARTIELTRRTLSRPAVTWRLIPRTGIAHLRIPFFGQDTNQLLARAIQSIERAESSGIILDLRNNPGGLLETAIDAANSFLKNGPVMHQKNNHGRIGTIMADAKDHVCPLPLIVLVNKGSAGGAEIVAGALRDNGRAILVGEQTFGSGTILKSFPLSDGSTIRLAVMEWLTPKGDAIGQKGIGPDRTVRLRRNVRPLLPRDYDGRNLGWIETYGDTQLLAALDLLAGAPRR